MSFIQRFNNLHGLLLIQRLTAPPHPIYGASSLPWISIKFQKPQTSLLYSRQLHFAAVTAPQKRFYSAAKTKEMAEYQAVVLGAGPAGIAVVGNLLAQEVKPILWIDDKFEGGRLNEKYREVPSNTRVCLFRDFATAIEPLNKIVEEAPVPNAFTVLEEMDGESRCTIAEAADLCKMLSDGLGPEKGVHKLQGIADQFEWSHSTKRWSIKATKTQPARALKEDLPTSTAKMLVLCHGSSPSPPPPSLSLDRIHTLACDQSKPCHIKNLQEVDLDLALKPSLLTELIPKSHPVQIAVIGASHSAILVLRNLFNLCTTTHPQLQVKWFTRHPLRYAIPQPDGWTLRDNTGLKGVAATFAKEYLEPDKITNSLATKFFTKFHTTTETEEEVYRKGLKECDFIVHAIGYKQDPFPPLIVDGKKLDENVLRQSYDDQSGRLRDGKGEVVKGLYGAGIAWPEKSTDPWGNVECSVGMWKFMRYMREVVPTWVESSIKGKA